MRDQFVIGMDSSTTACKAVVWDRAGRAVASGRAPLELLRPHPGWHEQSAERWWQAAIQALREAAAQVDASQIAALCITAQRETFVITGPDGEPRGNGLIWMDERCRDLLPEIEQRCGAQHIHAVTGKPLSANLSLGKLFWLARNQPDVLAPGTRFQDVHSFLSQRLTGESVTGWGCADPTGLFNLNTMTWDAGLVAISGLRVEDFPRPLPAGALAGRLTPEAARLTGLPDGLPLIAGVGDGQAAGLGVGVVAPGEAYLNLGTAVVMGAHSPQFQVARAFRTSASAIPGAFVLETVLLGGTYTVRWFVDTFGGNEQELEAEAQRIPPGAQGLLLLPYWNSAMNPYWDAAASGAVLGWRGIHGKAHLYRAILEGIALELRLHVEGVEQALGQPIQRLVAVGGGARSPLWTQMVADVTGRPVQRVGAGDIEASALGAGMLAAAGAGWFASPAEAGRAMAPARADPLQPDPERSALYDRIYTQVYRGLYPALKESMARLANIS